MKLSKLNKLCIEFLDAVVGNETSKVTVNNSGIVVFGEPEGAIEPILDAIRGTKLLNSSDLSKTFFETVEQVTDGEAFAEAVKHYASTYGTGFAGIMYVPNKAFGIEKPGHTPMYSLQVLTRPSIERKVLALLNSGIALQAETIEGLISILVELGRLVKLDTFKNQEANAYLDAKFGRTPSTVAGLLKLMLMHACGDSCVIKNRTTIDSLKGYGYFSELQEFADERGIDLLAEAFNRYKPLFLALKGAHGSLINKVSKRSKKVHKPMVESPINRVTKRFIVGENLNKVSTFAILRAINALYLVNARFSEDAPTLYKVRNGKTFVKAETSLPNFAVVTANLEYLINELRSRLGKLNGLKVFIPDGVDYALPTSEKSFIGNLPEFTTFAIQGKANIGVYWHNDGGARDLDLSATGVEGSQVSWCGSYATSSAVYSGDVTNAVDGATEYIQFTPEKLDEEYMLRLNVFDGDYESKYKLILGKASDKPSSVMLEPEDVVLHIPSVTEDKNTTLGVAYAVDDCMHFTLMSGGVSKIRVAAADSISTLKAKAALFNAKNRASLLGTLTELGVDLVSRESEAELSLRPELVNKDTFVSLFT